MTSYEADSSSMARAASPQGRSSQMRKVKAPPQEMPRVGDQLIDRFSAWKGVTKQLIPFFEGIAEIEYNTARELGHLGNVLHVPFQEAGQFLVEDGVHGAFTEVRDKTRAIATIHADLGRAIEDSVLAHLQKLRAEITAHIQSIQQDTSKLENSVAQQRELTTKMITELSKAIITAKSEPMKLTARDDPWVQNAAVYTQLKRQVNEENALTKSAIMMQKSSARFEQSVVRSLQMMWGTYEGWSGEMTREVKEAWTELVDHIRIIPPDAEWNAFAAQSHTLVDDDAPLRNIEAIDYPGRHNPIVMPLHQGQLERKIRFTKAYKESCFVLTPSGFLHELPSPDPQRQRKPLLSLFLPRCVLSEVPMLTSRTDRFTLTNFPQGGALSNLRGEKTYVFRARNHDDMLVWWDKIRPLSKIYLASKEGQDHSGSVDAAVRSAGNSRDPSARKQDGPASDPAEEVTDSDVPELPSSSRNESALSEPASLHPRSSPARKISRPPATDNYRSRSASEGSSAVRKNQGVLLPLPAYDPSSPKSESIKKSKGIIRLFRTQSSGSSVSKN